MLNNQFVLEACWLLFTIILLSFSGISFVLLVMPNAKFRLLASPFVGMLLLTLFTTACYIGFRMNFHNAILISYIVLIFSSGVTVFALRKKSIGRMEIIQFLFVFLIGALIFTWLCNYASVISNGPSISYLDGTDHIGYANLADWMVGNQVAERLPALSAPFANSVNPYEQLPNLMINWEPRIGAFAWLSIVSEIRSLPAVFAYDPACAIALSVSIIGIAAIFCETWVGIAILSIGLLGCHWIEFGHSGYFGKMLAYPSILFIIGLFVRSGVNRLVFPLVLLAASSGILLSGFVTGAFIFLFCGLIVLNEFRLKGRIDWKSANTLLTLVFVAIAADGLFVHPSNRGFPQNYLDYIDLAGRALDIVGWTSGPSYPNWLMCILIITMLVTSVFFGWLARNSGEIMVLLFSPVIIFIILLPLQSPILLQLSGLIYPSILCGAILFGQKTGNKYGYIGALVMVVLTSFHTESVIARYATGHSVGIFTKQEIDSLAKAVGNKTVLIDVSGNPQLALILMAEFGRRNIDIQWSEKDWYTVAGGWRKWPVPSYATKASFLISQQDGSQQKPGHFNIFSIPVTNGIQPN